MTQLLSGQRRRGFTLVEVLTALTILLIILGVVFSLMSGAVNVWQQSNTKIDAFENARAAFDTMTRQLSQATLNTYWDYYDSNHIAYRLTANPTTFIPATYGRYSDLHFICGQAAASSGSPESLVGSSLPGNYTTAVTHAVFFQTTTGLTANSSYQPLPRLLTACGYFVAFGSDAATRPGILGSTSPASRWRLLQLSSPTESLEVFAASSGTSWFTVPVSGGQVLPLADDVIALIVWPRLDPMEDPNGTQIAPDYSYDSRTTASWSGTPLVQPVQASQLPPTVQLTLVAMDEASAIHLQATSKLNSTITSALNGLFLTATGGTPTVQNYSFDLQTLENRLAASHINYRIFTTTVTLPESQWNHGS